MAFIPFIRVYRYFPDCKNEIADINRALQIQNGYMRFSIIFLSFLLFCFTSEAQVLTRAQKLIFTSEDSLQQGFNTSRTVLSGYGSAYYQRDFYQERGTASLERVVLFVGHQFNKKFSFFSEMELENALVAGLEAKGELAMEQAYLRYNINPRQYIVAGLFIPRIGLLNENHLPVNFNGVERPLIEQFVIPSTWRELGIGWYGTFNRLQLSGAIMNGLNSATFEHGTGLKDARNEGAFATANNMAVTAAAVYNFSPFRVQLSGYAGGTVGLGKRSADSLNLDGGAFGTPLYLGEADVKFEQDGFSAKVLGVLISYPDAGRINTAYGKNISSMMYGAYGEIGYDLLYKHSQKTGSEAQLIAFARLEYMDLNAEIPEAPKGIYDGTIKQSNLIAGFNFMPIPNITVKADVRLLHTGEQNKDLLINPPPNLRPYNQNNTFLNVGIGYSF